MAWAIGRDQTMTSRAVELSGRGFDVDDCVQERSRAVRAVASAAADAEDCRELLAVLGLRPAEGYPKVPKPRG